MTNQTNKQMINSLSKAVAKAKADFDYATAALNANENVDKIGGFELMQKTSENAWLDAKVAFGEFFPRVAFTVFVQGRNGNDLAAKIAEQTESVVFDMEKIVEKIMDPITTQARTSLHFGVYEFNILLGQIRSWADDYRLNMPLLTLDQTIYVANENLEVDTTKLRDAAYYFLAKLPNEFYKALVQDHVVRMAADLAIDSSVVPVIITNASQELTSRLVGTLFEGRSIVVAASAEPTADEALRVLKQIREIVAPEVAEKTNSKKTSKQTKEVEQ